MIEIGKQEQLTPQQATQIEEQYRINLNANMNTRSCFRAEEEKQDYHKEQCKKWCKNNSQHIKEYHKEWYKNNKEHMKAYAQTETAKASKVITDKKYRDKKKLEKQQKDITLKTV